MTRSLTWSTLLLCIVCISNCVAKPPTSRSAAGGEPSRETPPPCETVADVRATFRALDGDVSVLGYALVPDPAPVEKAGRALGATRAWTTGIGGGVILHDRFARKVALRSFETAGDLAPWLVSGGIDDEGIVLDAELALQLDLRVGDALVIQGELDERDFSSGASVGPRSLSVKVGGIIRLPGSGLFPQLGGQWVFLPKRAGETLGLSPVFHFDFGGDAPANVRTQLEAKVGERYRVLSAKELHGENLEWAAELEKRCAGREAAAPAPTKMPGAVPSLCASLGPDPVDALLDGIGGDVTMILPGALDPGLAERLTRDGRRVFTLTAFAGAAHGRRGSFDLFLETRAVLSPLAPFVVAGKIDDVRGSSIAVSAPFAWYLGVAAGDEVELDLRPFVKGAAGTQVEKRVRIGAVLRFPNPVDAFGELNDRVYAAADFGEALGVTALGANGLAISYAAGSDQPMVPSDTSGVADARFYDGPRKSRAAIIGAARHHCASDRLVK